MRSVSITALMVLAAFVLGLTLGGQTPRAATAQEELPEISWDVDGDTLIVVNNTEDKGYVARGGFLAGSETKIPPAFVEGVLKVDTRDLDGITIYEINPLFECDGMGCRACDDMPILCEMPPRPRPFNMREFHSTMGRRPVWD